MQGIHHSPLIFDEVTQTQSKVTQSKAELDLDSKAPIIHTTLAALSATATYNTEKSDADSEQPQSAATGWDQPKEMG